MGLFDALFGGGKPKHPPLDPAAPVASRLERHRPELEPMAGRVRDSLEAVPGERTLFVFIGKPPEMFGIAWFEDGSEQSLRSLMKDRGLKQAEVQRLSDQVRDAWIRHRAAARYSATVAGRAVTVTDSAALADDLDGLLAGLRGG